MSDPSMLVPGDFDVQAQAIARKRQLADLLMKQGIAPGDQGQMVSGHYVAPSPLASVNKVLSALMGAQQNESLDKDSADLNSKYQTGLGDAVKGYLNTKNGSSQEVPDQGPMPDGSAMDTTHTVTTPGDPRKAIVEAMTSQYKPLQSLGSAELGQLGKSALTPKDILGLSGYSPKAKVAAAMSGDISGLTGEHKDQVVNNQLFRTDGDSLPVSVVDARDRYNAPGVIGQGPEGPIVGQTDKETGKATFTPQGVKVNVDTGKKGADAFATAASDAAVKNLVESHAAAKKAQSSYEIFQNASTHINNMRSGTGSELILSAKKLAEQLGAPVDSSITSTEQVGAALGQAVLDNSKLLGSGNGFTDKDREFLQNIVLGKVSLDQETLKRAVNLGLAGSLNTMKAHDELLHDARDIPGAEGSVLKQFQVKIPHYSLDPEKFDYDTDTGRFKVKSNAVAPATHPATPATPTPGQSGLTPAEQARLAELRAHFGM